jgi:hypothetical protein
MAAGFAILLTIGSATDPRLAWAVLPAALPHGQLPSMLTP